jgi:hypothetical protein
MIYLLLGAAVLAFVFWGGKRPLVKGDGWRIGAGVAALMPPSPRPPTPPFAAAGARASSWASAACGARRTARRRATTRKASAPAVSGPSLTEARSILGVGPDATADEIRSAHARLIRLAHPDKGGTAGLAAQLNAGAGPERLPQTES